MPSYKEVKANVRKDVSRYVPINDGTTGEYWLYRIIPEAILKRALEKPTLMEAVAFVTLFLVKRFVYRLKPDLEAAVYEALCKGDLTAVTTQGIERFEKGEYGTKILESLDPLLEKMALIRMSGYFEDLLQLLRNPVQCAGGLRDVATGMSRVPWRIIIEDSFKPLTFWLSTLWEKGMVENETLLRRLDLWVRRLPHVRAWTICFFGGKALAAFSSIGIALMVLNLKGGISAGGDGVLWAAGAGILAYIAQDLYRLLVLLGTVTELRWHYIASSAFLTLGGFLSLSALGREGVSANPKPAVILTLVLLAGQLTFTFLSKRLRVKAKASLIEIEQKEAMEAASVEELISEMEAQLAEVASAYVEDQPEPEPDRGAELQGKTCKELRTIAVELGLTGLSKAKKADIIAAIREKEAQSEQASG